MSKNGNFEPFAFEAGLNDRAGSGLAITVAAAITPGVILGAAFAQRSNNTQGGLVWSAAAGTLTVATVQAEGTYDIEVHAGDLTGTASSALDIGIYRNGTLVGSEARKTELSSPSRMSVAPAVARGVALVVGDVVTARLRVGTDGHVGTFRQLSLMAKKVG
jgi:hypothetical protein